MNARGEPANFNDRASRRLSGGSFRGLTAAAPLKRNERGGCPVVETPPLPCGSPSLEPDGFRLPNC
jgi:hypothetical protein